MFVFLLRQPGEILSRTRIYGQPSREMSVFVSNTLNLHVNARVDRRLAP